MGMSVLSAYMYVHHMHARCPQVRGEKSDSSELELLLRAIWGHNPEPPQDQQVFVSAKPSFQLLWLRNLSVSLSYF